MPNYSKTRKRYKKKPKRRVRKYRSLTSRVVPSGLPVQRMAKLRFCERLTLSSTSGSLAEYVYRANSPFDPNRTGIGTSAFAFRNWANNFDHYVVLGSKISMKVMQAESSSAASNIVAAGCYLGDNNTTPYVDYAEFIMAKRGHTKLLCSRQASPATLTNTFSAKNFFGLSDVKDNKTVIGALTSTNPTEGAYYHVWCQSQDGQTTSVTFIVTIDYIVQFSEPKDIDAPA